MNEYLLLRGDTHQGLEVNLQTLPIYTSKEPRPQNLVSLNLICGSKVANFTYLNSTLTLHQICKTESNIKAYYTVIITTLIRP